MQIEDVAGYMRDLGRRARQASRMLARGTTAEKDRALLSTAEELAGNREVLLRENAKDLEQGTIQGLGEALLDRLELTPQRIRSMVEGLRQIAALPDPVGAISELCYRPTGIQVGRMRVPLGVVGIIYESRPNVTADAAALCLKAGNAVVLRGGKGLIERISREARVPVIKHLDGICHTYIDDQADLDKAFAVALNAKTQRYGTCNTMETLLVAEAVAEQILPRLAVAYWEHGVELRGCPRTCGILGERCQPATAEDWDTEYLAPILSIRVLPDMDSAIDHIARHSSQHTDAIITEDYSRARRFLREVDSSSVMVNASTRFADGFEYGLGAEIGISTDKFHARGPVGLDGLTSLKFVVLGDGHVRR